MTMLCQVIKELNDYTDTKGVAKYLLLKCPCGAEFKKRKVNVRDNTLCVPCSMHRRSIRPQNLYTRALKSKLELCEELLKTATLLLPEGIALREEIDYALKIDVNEVQINKR